MKIIFFVHTPAQAHFWRNIFIELKNKGHQINLLVRDHGPTCEVLNKHSILYEIYGKGSQTSCGKILQLPSHFLRSLSLVNNFKPDIFLGTGIIEAYISFLLRKPCIIYEDSEPTPFLERIQWLHLARIVVTPDCLRKDLGKKQFRLAAYKELAYLHPNFFQPDLSVLDELGLGKDERYVILRFNAFDAVHDIGRQGFDLNNKYRLVEELQKYARVFISSETALPDDLEGYNLPISFERIHHALYYAQLLVTDTQTMTTEAAILGTPAVRCNNFVGPDDMGNFIELEQKYGLIYNYREPDKAIKKAVELIKNPGLKEEWRQKREALLKDKIDITAFMAWFIENYPESYKDIKQNPGLQYSFR